LIVITGLQARELIPFLGFSAVPEIWGTYGLERIYSYGSQWRHQYMETALSEEAARDLANAELHLDSEGLGEHIEVKLAGVAVQWSGLEPSTISSIKTKALGILEPLSRHPDLVINESEDGIEVSLRSVSKDQAISMLLSEIDPNIPLAYLGSDTTDEETFRIVNTRGLAVMVRPNHGRPTLAQVCISPPKGLIKFLNDWIRACGHRQL
jgi:trehalose-6-phosphatase